MASSYTTSLRLVLPVTGENSGTWGDLVNTGITNLVDASVAGYAAVTMTDADYTLTSVNGAADEARKMMLNISGTLTAARNVICPTASKLYFIKNATTGGYAITLKTSAGTGISVPNGAQMVLMCDGTNVTTAVTYASSFNAGSIGATIPGTGAFTTLSASSTVSGTGFTTYLASPPAIGGTAAAAGSFSNLSYSGTFTGGTGVINIGSGQFYKDASGNIGVGTATPGSTFDVKGTLRLSGATSGYVGLAPAAAAGAVTYTLPSADGTVGQVLRTSGAGVLSWVTAGAGTVTGVTGTAPVVSSGGTAPVISMAAASSGVNGYMTGVYATKLDGITAGASVTSVTGTAPVSVATGTTTPVISMAAATSSNNGYMTTTYATRLDSAIAGNATGNFGYLNIPQNSQSAAYTLVIGDSGKHILHPSADTYARTYTIPANSSVAFPIGTAVTFVNQNGAGDITIAITTDTMRLAGAGTTGSRTLAANGTATALKVTATEWLISGVNLT